MNEKKNEVGPALIGGTIGGIIAILVQSSNGWVGWDFFRIFGVLYIGVLPGVVFGIIIINKHYW
jgi:hypothetical protein